MPLNRSAAKTFAASVFFLLGVTSKRVKLKEKQSKKRMKIEQTQESEQVTERLKSISKKMTLIKLTGTLLSYFFEKK